MPDLIIRPTIVKYINVSEEVLRLFGNFLTIWGERGKDIDVIEARKIYTFMIKEDQRREKPHITDTLLFERHSWVVGEYAADLARKLLIKHPNLAESELPLTPKEIEYAGGSHDIAKLLLVDNYRYAHEHLAWAVLVDNNYGDLASLTQPHHPGEETVLNLIHSQGHFLDINKENFCKNRQFQFVSDLIMLADMSCDTGYVGARTRIDDIRKRYNATDHLVVGINDPEKGEKRVIAIEEKVNQLLF